MNMKEMEALVIRQGALIEELQARVQTDPIPVLAEAVNNLSGRVDRVVEGFTNQLKETNDKVSEMKDHQDGINDTLYGAVEDVKNLQRQMGAEDEDGPFGPELKSIRDKLEEIVAKVEGRNKSAAVKRNMTDADALRVLTGDLRELAHKETAEQIGLTYAQVYSCRLEFTFKHVHKALRDTEWKNPWSK
jgi:hypothetical protein